jgi:drug/metabolite transporter (DMT)-like permease
MFMEKATDRTAFEIRPFKLVTALMAIVGVGVLIPELSFQNVNVRGALVGLLAAFSFAAHLIVNDRARINIKAQTG